MHDFLVRYGGAERTLSVLAEMFPDAPIYTLFYDEARMGRHFPKERVRTSRMQWVTRLPGRLYRLLLPHMPRAFEDFSFAGFDLVISSSTAFAHGIIVPQQTTHICYCHSPARYLWDYTHAYLDDHRYGGLMRFFATRTLGKLREWDFAAGDRPDHYIANSQHVKGRIAKYFQRDSDVIYPPVDVERFSISEQHEDYFLIVSQLSRYKRVDLAVQLFTMLGKRLVIIGTGPDESYLRRIAGPTVELLGYKSDDEVATYMRYTRAVIFPGEDDFGIVPIEAMACGKPVLAYARGGATETVVPGVNGELFYEPTVSSLQDGLARLLLHELHYDARAIRSIAEKYSRRVFEKHIKRFVHER